MHFSFLVALAVCTAGCLGHPGEPHKRMEGEVFFKKREELSLRNSLAQQCSPSIARHISKRQIARSQQPLAMDPTPVASANEPHFTEIQNFTCITTPKVGEGPFFIHNELIRPDLREEQKGVPLILDIGVLDVDTCEPLSDVFVEIWSCNATGHYSGFTAFDPSKPFPQARNVRRGSPMTDNLSFLRGGLPTNEEGLVELTTLYPGFYSGRAVHTHVVIHQNWRANLNGTIDSNSGSVPHIGQLFFDEAWNDHVLRSDNYGPHPETRIRNIEDYDFVLENSGGYNAMVSLEKLGDSLQEGVLGYITIGVNTTHSYELASTNYATKFNS